jgi:plasmid stabilization system protein ParE
LGQLAGDLAPAADAASWRADFRTEHWGDSRIDWRRVVKEEETDHMPQGAWSPKRERQYEHIKEGLLERGNNEEKAEEIAARTVNKERARHGETKAASRTSINDISSGRRGGLRSHSGSGGRTYDQLRNEARERGIKGRSRMRKAQLEKILSR